MAAHDKPILTETPLDLSSMAVAPYLNAKDFKQSISNHGYDIMLEKALFCPCKDKANGHVDVGCKNCGATGWIFVNKTKTRALISHINQQTKFLNWTEENVGTINISTTAEDKVGYMDRVTILDVETVFSQIAHVRKSSSNKLFAFLAYEPVEIEAIYLFENASSPLIPVAANQYTIQNNKIILDDIFLAALAGVTDPQLQYLNLTVRYYHLPVYHIIDINREVMKNRSKDCATGGKTLKELPISSVGKKPHTMFETPNFTGEGLFDNTIYP